MATVRVPARTVLLGIKTVVRPARTVLIGIRTVLAAMPAARVATPTVPVSVQKGSKTVPNRLSRSRNCPRPLAAGTVGGLRFPRTLTSCFQSGEDEMTSKEYERRRRAIEEQCQADIELIRVGCQAKLRALEMVWLHSAGGEEVPQQVSSETVSRTVPGETVPVETVPSEVQDSGAARSSGWADVLHDVKAVFLDLPEVFDKSDLCQAIGYKPSRSTLLRVLGILEKEGKVAVNFSSQGGRQTQYRKILET
jgi:hypothetical protein